MFRRFSSPWSWPIGVTGVALAACAWLGAPAQGFAQSVLLAAYDVEHHRLVPLPPVPPKPHAGEHLYVMLGLANLSPGLTDFGDAMAKQGVATTVGSYTDWDTFTQDAIQKYQNGQARSIMIIGHSLGGGAARAMAAKLGEADVPVKLLVTLDPVGDLNVPANVQRSVNILPGEGENHFSMINAHADELRGYVLGAGVAPDLHARARVEDQPQPARNVYGSIN